MRHKQSKRPTYANRCWIIEMFNEMENNVGKKSWHQSRVGHHKGAQTECTGVLDITRLGEPAFKLANELIFASLRYVRVADKAREGLSSSLANVNTFIGKKCQSEVEEWLNGTRLDVSQKGNVGKGKVGDKNSHLIASVPIPVAWYHLQTLQNVVQFVGVKGHHGECRNDLRDNRLNGLVGRVNDSQLLERERVKNCNLSSN